jgi:hypothetical protein
VREIDRRASESGEAAEGDGMTRRTKLALMVYRAMELYLSLYPKERVRLRRMVKK